MTDFEWPDPVPSTPRDDILRTGMVSPEVGRALAPDAGLTARRAHVAHEGTGGDPACEWCVFTEDGYQTHNCRSCTRPIVWAYTVEHNLMPVDASADPAGNVVLSRRAGTVHVTVLDQASLFDDGVRRTSHFATCPDANGWRKTR